jgi:hypothetical protein
MSRIDNVNEGFSLKWKCDYESNLSLFCLGLDSRIACVFLWYSGVCLIFDYCNVLLVFVLLCKISWLMMLMLCKSVGMLNWLTAFHIHHQNTSSSSIRWLPLQFPSNVSSIRTHRNRTTWSATHQSVNANNLKIKTKIAKHLIRYLLITYPDSVNRPISSTNPNCRLQRKPAIIPFVWICPQKRSISFSLGKQTKQNKQRYIYSSSILYICSLVPTVPTLSTRDYLEGVTSDVSIPQHLNSFQHFSDSTFTQLFAAPPQPWILLYQLELDCNHLHIYIPAIFLGFGGVCIKVGQLCMYSTLSCYAFLESLFLSSFTQHEWFTLPHMKHHSSLQSL